MAHDLRARLKEARRKLRLTQAEAAKAWGVPLNTLICWENNRRNPAAFSLVRLNLLLDGILGPASSTVSVEPPELRDINPPDARRDIAAGG